MPFNILSFVILIILLGLVSPTNYTEISGIRQRFEQRFVDSCSKYPFVKKYHDIQYFDPSTPSNNKYLIFVFHEAGQGSNGGLGDRLAGMITALAFAIRSKRIFLVQGDSSFEEAFQPFRNKSMINMTYANDDREYSWRTWEWSGWKSELGSNANVHKMKCVNPRSHRIECALDRMFVYSHVKVIKYYGNRCYLCRWSVKSSLRLQKDLYENLGINSTSFLSKENIDKVDLYEIGGCLLRLVL